MPANRNALIRYRTLDDCLRNRQRRWLLDDLIEKVAEALYEFEGRDAGISRRTVQADLQMMRSDKLGYNAPIVVIERKYYTYDNPEYSITQSPLTRQDLQRLTDSVAVLRQFSDFAHFQELGGVVQKLEAHLYAAATNNLPVIDFEKNENLRGLAFLDPIYQAIVARRSLLVTYQSFKAREPQQFVFHGWWLKEFKNRWFVVGHRGNPGVVQHLALDRIQALDPAPADTPYVANPGLMPAEFYRDVIGVTVSQTMRAQRVQISITAEHAPYVLTKPLHPSQQLIREAEGGGVVVEIRVQVNFELEREILGFADGMEVLSPPWLRDRIRRRLVSAAAPYNEPMPDPTASRSAE